MTEPATMLLFCDSRVAVIANANNQLPDDSVVALPLKRDTLRKVAQEKNYTIRGEVILEIEKGADLEALVTETVEKIAALGNKIVLCADRSGLAQAGIFSVLQLRLQQHSLTVVEY